MTHESAVKSAQQWLDDHTQDMVEALQGALRIRSLQAPPSPGAPFGPECKLALDYTLGICSDLGFRIHDDDGYAGHAEFGAGAEMVAAIGHLDVVPEGDGWTFPPYSAEIENGFIYARGSADDKGPTYAALFAAVALLKTNAPLQKRIRIIFGCNEESGFECVKHYWEVSNNERPVAAFTPDSRFPMIYAEKGIANLYIEAGIPDSDSQIELVEFSGGRRPNMVPDYCEAVIRGNSSRLATIENCLKKFWDRNVAFVREGDLLRVSAIGKSAHGARPEGGDNAIARLARALAAIEVTKWKLPFEKINLSADTAGRTLGIAAVDDIAGPLTSNLGMASVTQSGAIKLTYNIRYPVTSSFETLKSCLMPALEQYNWTLAGSEDQPPLYMPLDQEPAKTLLRVYQEETGDTESQPGTMGGGTYARATPHSVAFGANFPGGSDGPAHEPDERIAINTLVRAAHIYIRALYELAR